MHAGISARVGLKVIGSEDAYPDFKDRHFTVTKVSKSEVTIENDEGTSCMGVEDFTTEHHTVVK